MSVSSLFSMFCILTLFTKLIRALVRVLSSSFLSNKTLSFIWNISMSLLSTTSRRGSLCLLIPWSEDGVLMWSVSISTNSWETEKNSLETSDRTDISHLIKVYTAGTIISRTANTFIAFNCYVLIHILHYHS